VFDGSFYNGCYTEGQGGNSSSSCSYFSVLEVTFDAPTNYVQIVGDFGPDGPGLEPILFAYASDGSVISGCRPFAGGPRLRPYRGPDAGDDSAYLARFAAPSGSRGTVVAARYMRRVLKPPTVFRFSPTFEVELRRLRLKY
jgi:hypothetical protein